MFSKKMKLTFVMDDLLLPVHNECWVQEDLFLTHLNSLEMKKIRTEEEEKVLAQAPNALAWDSTVLLFARVFAFLASAIYLIGNHIGLNITFWNYLCNIILCLLFMVIACACCISLYPEYSHYEHEYKKFNNIDNFTENLLDNLNENQQLKNKKYMQNN